MSLLAALAACGGLSFDADPGASWTSAETAAACAVGSRLPPSPPLTLVKHPGVSPDRRPPPPRPDHRAARAFLLDPPPGTDPSRATVLLERAVAHQVAHALDEASGWSRGGDWSDLARAGLSPAEDLAAYAESFFLDAAVTDAHARCDQPSRYRFLAARLPPSYTPPLASVDCPGFEAWIQPAQVESIEVLFAAPSTRRAVSLWGHLLLSVRHRSDPRIPPGFEPVFHVGADAEGAGGLAKAWRGLTGGFAARVVERPDWQVRHDYRLADGRSLRRFPLLLDEEETRRLLERLWEARRLDEEWPYRFFTDNCSGLLVELIESALGKDLQAGRPRGIRSPSSALDLLSRASLHGHPLLGRSREDPGLAEQASAAAVERRELAPRLTASSGDSHLLDQDRSGDARKRLAVYQRVAREAGETPEAGVYLDRSLELESYAAWRDGAPGGVGGALPALADLEASLPRAPAPRGESPPGRPMVRESGMWHGGTAGGFDSQGRPRLEVEGAALDDRPGEEREDGLGPDLGMRCLGARFAFESGGLVAHRETVIDFRSLRHELPEIEAWPRRDLSYALQVGGWGDRRRGFDAMETAAAGPEALVFQGADRSSLLRAGLLAGPALLLPSTGGPQAALQATAELAARVPAGPGALDAVDLSLAGEGALGRAESGWTADVALALQRQVGGELAPWTVGLTLAGEAGGIPAPRDPRARVLLEVGFPW